MSPSLSGRWNSGADHGFVGEEARPLVEEVEEPGVGGRTVADSSYRERKVIDAFTWNCLDEVFEVAVVGPRPAGRDPKRSMSAGVNRICPHRGSLAALDGHAAAAARSLAHDPAGRSQVWLDTTSHLLDPAYRLCAEK